MGQVGSIAVQGEVCDVVPRIGLERHADTFSTVWEARVAAGLTSSRVAVGPREPQK